MVHPRTVFLSNVLDGEESADEGAAIKMLDVDVIEL